MTTPPHEGIHASVDNTPRKQKKDGFYNRYAKRALDLIAVLPLIVLTSPIAAVIAIAIKIEDHGPVFFIQDRSGLDGKTFKLLKFRSMSVGNDVHDFSTKNYETKVGCLIRKLSLDELPQLFNILRGEMSFIGPRPWIEDYSKYFTKNQARRLEVRPGLSGLAQIKSRNNLSIKQKIKWDIYYVEHVSFFIDCEVLFRTIYTLFDKDGAKLSKEGIKQELEELKCQNR